MFDKLELEDAGVGGSKLGKMLLEEDVEPESEFPNWA